MIIIIDDELEAAEVIEYYLGEHGLSSKCFTNANQALNFIKNQKVYWAIVDLSMPDLNGFEFAKEAQKINSKLRFICISGLCEPLQDDLRNSHFEMALQKPITSEEFAKTVVPLVKRPASLEVIS